MTKIVDPEPANLVDRLAEHRQLANTPRGELEWLATHGELRHFDVGDVPLVKGAPLEHMMVQLSGRIATSVDSGAGRRYVIDTGAGEITGLLPFSRGTASIGNVSVTEAADVMFVHRSQFPEMMRACPTVIEAAVHSMLDRARQFSSTSFQDDKMMSLGRLAAGLAHELNNPASAASRSAKQLREAVAASHRAAEALGGIGLTETQRELVDAAANGALMPATTGVFSALQQADREDEIADWLDEHDADHAPAEALAESGVTRESLDALAEEFERESLDVVLRWIAAEYVVRSLAAEVDRATTRIHDLVSAVKRFTYMDRAAAPELTDVLQSVSDTVMVLRSKAKAKSVAIDVDLPSTLPKVMANAGELNQVWANLIENAIDAVPSGGRVHVIARHDGAAEVAVCIADNGPGVPADIQSRIFEPFFTTKPIGQGTGLGLDIARRIVLRFDGKIALDSRPGHTEFRVVLPVAKGG